MSAVERLQAAIDKLETLRDDAPPSPWEVYPFWSSVVLHAELDLDKSTGYEVLSARTPAISNLTSTLSRTIDAQLAILREGIPEYYRSSTDHPTDLFKRIMALADSILGVES